jgi:hypothetical protein
MSVDKMSISLRSELGEAARTAAERSGQGLSSWIAEAVAAKLRADALDEFLEGWQAQHGFVTSEEIVRAEIELGYRSAAPSR